jgi:hypothetical protein
MNAAQQRHPDENPAGAHLPLEPLPGHFLARKAGKGVATR